MLIADPWNETGKPFHKYIDCVYSQNAEDTECYWGKYLEGVSDCPFPKLRQIAPEVTIGTRMNFMAEQTQGFLQALAGSLHSLRQCQFESGPGWTLDKPWAHDEEQLGGWHQATKLQVQERCVPDLILETAEKQLSCAPWTPADINKTVMHCGRSSYLVRGSDQVALRGGRHHNQHCHME